MKSQNQNYKIGIFNVNTMNKSFLGKKKVWIHSSHLIREKRSPISKERGRMEDLCCQVAGQFKVSLGYRGSS